MFVGTLQFELYLYGCSSLKEKRLIIKSLKTRLRNQFNVSVAETEYLDKWQRTQIAVVTVSNKKSHAEEVIQKVFAMVEKEDRGEIIEHLIDIY